jgi:hypothetical protein
MHRRSVRSGSRLRWGGVCRGRSRWRALGHEHGLRGLQLPNLEINDDLFSVRILCRQMQHISRDREKLGFLVLSPLDLHIQLIDGPCDFIQLIFHGQDLISREYA